MWPKTAGLKHGMSGTREYRCWQSVKARCLNPKCADYENYGGRGIAMCPEWRDSFSAFIKHIGLSPTNKHTVDRVDNNKGYEPGNVRWATAQEQNKNKRSNFIVVYQGRTYTLIDLARKIAAECDIPITSKFNKSSLCQYLRRFVVEKAIQV